MNLLWHEIHTIFPDFTLINNCTGRTLSTLLYIRILLRKHQSKYMICIYNTYIVLYDKEMYYVDQLKRFDKCIFFVGVSICTFVRLFCILWAEHRRNCTKIIYVKQKQTPSQYSNQWNTKSIFHVMSNWPGYNESTLKYNFPKTIHSFER